MCTKSVWYCKTRDGKIFIFRTCYAFVALLMDPKTVYFFNLVNALCSCEDEEMPVEYPPIGVKK